MSHLHPVPPSRLRIGEPLAFDCYDAKGDLMFKKGQAIATEKQLDRMLERGVYGLILETEPEEQPTDTPYSPFQHLEDLKNSLSSLFSSIVCQPERENTVETINFEEQIQVITKGIQLLCETAADEAIGAFHLYPVTRYTLIQPLRRAILCELVGARKGIPAQERQTIIAAALTCDLSMLDLQEELHHQSAPVTPEQKRTIAEHPENTVTLLESLGVRNSEWLITILHHHERLSGKGYPYQLQGNDIFMHAKLIALADIYAAMVTPRAYRGAILSRSAMKDIFIKRGSEVDEGFTVLFIKEMGVYPPGSFVKLQNGETAIVIKRSANPSQPIVKSVVGPRGAPLDRPIKRNTAVVEHQILDAVERDPIVVIDFHTLWEC